MNKCIYYGPAKDFWWHRRFEEFMDNADYAERLSEKNPILTSSPIIWYSDEYNVAVQYFLENTICPKVIVDGEPFIQRARVTLFWDENNIKDLEIIIRSEAGRFHGRDEKK